MPGGGANLGRWFESAIEQSSRSYRHRAVADVEKQPTPYRMVGRGQNKKLIRTQSSVDFHGVVLGVSVAFDAKTVKGASIPFRNVHEHQLAAMESHISCGGLGFLIVNMECDGGGTWVCTPAWWRSQVALHVEQRKSVPILAFELAAEEPFEECVEVRHGANGVVIDYAPAVTRLHLLHLANQDG